MLFTQGGDEDDDDDLDSLSDSLSSSSISDTESESFKDAEEGQAGGPQSTPAPAEWVHSTIVTNNINAAGAPEGGGPEQRGEHSQSGPGLPGVPAAICHRTRARCPLEDVTLEQLEALGLPDEDILPLSDDEYYQEFLEVCFWLGPFLIVSSQPGMKTKRRRP